jgi:hypothetical protein
LAIGYIIPQEDEATEVEVPQVAAAPISADIPNVEQQQTPATTPACGSAAPIQSAVVDSTLLRGQNLQPIFEQKEDKGPEDEQEAVEHPRLKQTIQQDHPIDNIIGSLRKGILTCSHLTNFSQYYSFVSPVKPLKVEKSLEDEDWVMAMQEELNIHWYTFI